ncbi:hypothetical protein vseg_006708 [Gypsophila vaccaria]
MPRPGPRPYECVRRAWHSDRHQPIRGSLIQDIFRIAHEIHNPATKKKKEWQEKLPIVVLKAEEIMYSKANSEAEYMDPKTLWDRTNDAINIIIRRDDGSEDSGEFLQPCIEAALHLGCIPRRTSRSQRNVHPRGYLTGTTDFPIATNVNVKPNSSLAPHYANFLGNEPQKYVVSTNSCLHNEMLFLSGRAAFPSEGSIPLKSCPVYPLHYGVYQQPKEPQPTHGRLLASEITMSQTSRTDLVTSSKDQPITECDLSLRLGFGSVKTEGSRSANVKQNSPNANFSLCCGNNAGSGGEIFDMGLMVRKRKAVEQPEMFLAAKDYACLL